jgi:hypothetical protein
MESHTEIYAQGSFWVALATMRLLEQHWNKV